MNSSVLPSLPQASFPTTTTPVVWADPAREQAFGAWLASLAQTWQLDTSTVGMASADASFRRYFRVASRDGKNTFIIMDAPPALEDCSAFVKVAGLMVQAGLNAPKIVAWDAPQGFMLLNDLGARTMLDIVMPLQSSATVLSLADHESQVHRLYMQAVDALIVWQLSSKPDVLPAYDDALLSRELMLFPEWYVSRHRGIDVGSTMQGKLAAIFSDIKRNNLEALQGARVFVHRDFMPRNLVLNDQMQMGVLDFQDAVYGPITYDIASLMRDAFLSWDEEFVLDITVRYWQKAQHAGLPVGQDFGEFYRAVEWMGLQRHLKVLGIFARLTLRDGKPRYLADAPRFIHYARSTAARYRQLGPLMVLLDEIEGNPTRVGYTF